MKPTERWRWLVAGDILLHLVAVWFFALLPPATLNKTEMLVMGMSFFAAVGVITHAMRCRAFPGDHWAYLIAGFVCMFTLIAYETRAFDELPTAITVPFGLFLFAGTVSSFAAHVIDGGQKRGCATCGG